MRLTRETTVNKLLRFMTAADFARLQPSLSAIELPTRRQLEERNRHIEHVYFLERGLASMVISAGSGRRVDVGIIGCEGMTGLPVLLESDRATYEVIMQSAGSGWRIAAQDLRLALAESTTLRRTLLRYAHTVMAQMAFTALSNGNYRVEERLARWLLMADDRVPGGIILLTHEFLAMMLNTRRAGITIALNLFQKQNAIAASRGRIEIRSRAALIEAANGSYGSPETEYQRLFPN